MRAEWWGGWGGGLLERVTPGHRHEGGGLCQKTDPSRDLKPELLLRPPSLWQNPDVAIAATEPDLWAKAAHDAKQ